MTDNVSAFLSHLGVEEDPVEGFLEHFGVKGMKWGRKSGATSSDGTPIPRKTNKDAGKDAAEFARAKMFFGEGAGNRRKLIKATVDAKAKKDPLYKDAFDQHLAAQDMGKHASKAQKERKRKDVSATTGKTARGVHRQLTGGFGNVSLASAAIAAVAVGARQTGADKMIFDAAKKSVNNAKANRDSGKQVNDWLKNNGFS